MVSQPTNTFVTDPEGWAALGEGVGATPTATWVAINGNPAGCYTGSDMGSGSWYYNSSAIFNTDLSEFYGSFLNFNLKQNTSASQTNEADVIIFKTDGTKIVYSTPLNPGTAWTSYSVPFSESGWKHTTLAGAIVTSAEFISCITNISVIKIRGDYSTLNTETVWLDNVNISDIVVLPISLNYFSGLQQTLTVSDLTWETLSETNSNYFQIEKSSNGGLNFDSIGLVKAVGSAEASNTYHFSDARFNANAYYRLKQVDIDGQVSYSEIIFLQNDGKSFGVNIYPNPANTTATIDFAGNAFEFNTIRVTDCYSKTVYLKTGIENNFADKIDLDVQKLLNGTYFISLQNEKEMQSYVIQVMH